MEIVRKPGDTKLVATEKRRNYLVPKPNYHATKFLTENLLPIEMTETQILTDKPIYLGLSTLDLSKTVMYELLYNYIKPK